MDSTSFRSASGIASASKSVEGAITGAGGRGVLSMTGGTSSTRGVGALPARFVKTILPLELTTAYNSPTGINNRLNLVLGAGRPRFDQPQQHHSAEEHGKLISQHVHNLKCLRRETQPRYCTQLVKLLPIFRHSFHPPEQNPGGRRRFHRPRPQPL